MRRVSLAFAAVIVVCLAVPALAQTARASGTVKDTSGKTMKGATVRATNKDAYPSQITSTTDDKGRWAMIGLRTGTWTFVVESPGYAKDVDIDGKDRPIAGEEQGAGNCLGSYAVEARKKLFGVVKGCPGKE